jgi:hypothetical protein
MKQLALILYLLAIVAVGAIGDALYDMDKIWAHNFNAIEIGMLLAMPFLFKYGWWAIVAYISFRIFAFDYTYNLVRGLPLAYVGSTSWWDLLLVKQLPMGVAFAKILFLAFGVGLIYKKAT